MDDLKIENELSSETQDTKGFDALSREEIVEKLCEDVFNATVANW